MNNFAHIKPLFKYNKVAYYSVVLNDNKETWYDEFVKNHEQKITGLNFLFLTLKHKNI